MFKIGTELVYKVSRTVDGRPEGLPHMETYRVLSIEDESATIEKRSEIGETQILETRTSFGSLIFSHDRFVKGSDSPVQIEFEGCLIYADILDSPPRCGGSEKIYLGRDRIVYKDERTQMWSRGVVCTETRKLLSITVDGRVYEDIKWVDEYDPTEDEQ